ncbi:hypothetical protein DFH09DRAFT_1457735 [Mycena vulgaris]|nr:hypothetical protein DFH09DRAFT_1457735 [Mycena vulgaris]
MWSTSRTLDPTLLARPSFMHDEIPARFSRWTRGSRRLIQASFITIIFFYIYSVGIALSSRFNLRCYLFTLTDLYVNLNSVLTLPADHPNSFTTYLEMSTSGYLFDAEVPLSFPQFLTCLWDVQLEDCRPDGKYCSQHDHSMIQLVQWDIPRYFLKGWDVPPIFMLKMGHPTLFVNKWDVPRSSTCTVGHPTNVPGLSFSVMANNMRGGNKPHHYPPLQKPYSPKI